MRRADICLYLGPAHRAELQALITNRNLSRKLVWRFFAEITSTRIRRGSFSSADDLEAAVYDYLAQHNGKPKPFRWTKSAENILTRERRALNALDDIRGNR